MSQIRLYRFPLAVVQINQSREKLFSLALVWDPSGGLKHGARDQSGLMDAPFPAGLQLDSGVASPLADRATSLLAAEFPQEVAPT